MELIKCAFRQQLRKTFNIAVGIACDKEQTKRMLNMASIPVPMEIFV
jgi:hypothetical protein